ncbi:hypothetical protein HanXRQr2_Chr11g0505431 [Helianthus annuus]|uniref:Uncharacterized protein n=1 Tax=Helianthus annuus TaxID=4232 RepID=A0A9K3EFG6_HELAN|nr:hypothetical protein HanXRQr2_Chr13g0571411 [Helianthus annuus]KAF5783221.1 hypothetical protein HanXRQr2_Chr11g0505431 [Helianthus annuus]KAJ0847850.1 hypothetical protein HanPSC8_Chr13g0550131 [Helianthus annuus]KAJ0847851.1 hypothetical protein HanPSC8_Chr13g0550141 [Helianthus annuus]KAJ0882258.1 hypothetical protein HanPSC8_Chr10g0407601 [Helianthus annuus]
MWATRVRRREVKPVRTLAKRESSKISSKSIERMVINTRLMNRTLSRR